MFVPVFSTTILAAPTIGSAAIDGSDQLVVSLVRGSDDPDFDHFLLYWSTTAGIDIANAGTYDGTITSADGNIVDLGPWTEPIYLVATEVAFNGDESGSTAESSILAGGGSGLGNAAAHTIMWFFGMI